MADTNTYDSFQKVEKWTTKEKFNALDTRTIATGTEYNLAGAIDETDLGSDLLAKINGKLTAPTTPTADSAVTLLSDGTVGTKPLSEISVGGKLYRHDLHITRTATSSVFGYSVYCSFYASSNLKITSAGDLRTVVGNYFTLMATGYLSGTNANYDPVEAIFQTGVRPIKNNDQTYAEATFDDDVTKII